MKKHNPSNKILITIPYWERDRAAAMGLSQLLADIQPNHSDDFDVLFVARFDAKLPDPGIAKYVSRKFNVFTYTSKRRETGWPGGCNGTFFGSLEFIYHKMNMGQIPGYKAIFMCEADSIPLSRDCFAYLHRQWDGFACKKSVCLAGAVVPDGGREHINGGCCLLSGSMHFLKWIAHTVGGMKAQVGWDYGLAADFRARGWANILGIKSFWNTPTASAEAAECWARQGLIWVHGVKDDSLMKHARRMLV